VGGAAAAEAASGNVPGAGTPGAAPRVAPAVSRATQTAP
jgi:hypothetical protein